MYLDVTTVVNQNISHKIVPGGAMMAMTEDNNGHQPEAANPTGEIIRAMTQCGTFLVTNKVVLDVTGTHYRVPLNSFLYPAKDIRGVPMAVPVLGSTSHYKIETTERVHNLVMCLTGDTVKGLIHTTTTAHHHQRIQVLNIMTPL